MARNLERSIDRVRAHVARGVFGVRALIWFAGVTSTCACVALGLRAALGWDAARASLAFAPLVLVPFVALHAARRKPLSAAGAAAWLDVRAGADGALVTGFETGAHAWNDRVEAAIARAHPLPRARLLRPAWLSAAALAFAALALFVPIPRTLPGPDRALQVVAIEKAEEQLATLEEEVRIDPELAAELHASLQRMKEDEAGLASAESLFEAADRAAERLADEAAAQAEPAEDLQRALDAAAASAGTDAEAGQKELEAALAELAKSGLSKGLEDMMTSELGLPTLELLPGMKLDAAQIARMATALRARLGDKLAKLAAAGLLKPGDIPGLGGEPADIDIVEHICDAECGKNPGGT